MIQRRRRWSPEVVVEAIERLNRGEPAATVGERLGVPTATIRTWARGAVPSAARHVLAGGSRCPECGDAAHDRAGMAREPVAYLLGACLGDGCLARHQRTWSLRVTRDVAHPGVIDEVVRAVTIVRGRTPGVRRPAGQNYVVVTSYWRSWPCWLGAYRPGKKHERRIVLAPWQEDLVRSCPGPFARGLIHTDGWRGENRVTVKGRTYAYPRYQFSNRSDDIRRLFTDACDALGVAWRPWRPYAISVARRDAVRASR